MTTQRETSARNDLKSLRHLGSNGTEYGTDYDPGLLETFDNQHEDREYTVTFECPEFTTLCPKTGQPDFGKLYISYIPRRRMVESKSLKLYLFSFRNHGDFHEDCVNIIARDLWELMEPRYLEVRGVFMPRGGISIHPFVCLGDDEHRELCERRRLQSLDFNSIPKH